MDPERDYFEDEIDLREIARTLLRYKWLILILPVILAVAAWAYSRYFMPTEYQATALVMVSQPGISTDFDPRLSLTPQTPDAATLVDLATVDDLVEDVNQVLQAENVLPKDMTAKGLEDRLKASAVGTKQVRLTVTDTDPIRAAKIANTWAERLSFRFNDLYGSGEASLVQLLDQIDLAFQNWSEKEEELLATLPDNPVDSLQVRLNQAKESLTVYLDQVRVLDLSIKNAELLDERLARQSSGDSLRVEDALSLISIYQQSLRQLTARDQGEVQSLQLQISTPDILGQDYTVAEARANLQDFIETLQARHAELDAAIVDLEQQVTSLATELEAATYRKTQLTVQRDLALTAYQALSSQAEETRISLAQNDQPVKVVGRALPNPTPSGPRSLFNAAIAAAVGFILAVMYALGKEWWQSPQEVVQPKEVRQVA